MWFSISTHVSMRTPPYGTHILEAVGVPRREREAFPLCRADSLRYGFLIYLREGISVEFPLATYTYKFSGLTTAIKYWSESPKLSFLVCTEHISLPKLDD